MEAEQNQPIEEQKEIPQEPETAVAEAAADEPATPEPTKKGASPDESKEDWDSLKFDITEDECNETNYAEWISNAKSKEYRIKKSDLTELKAFSKPPQRVCNAFSIAYYILRKKNRPYDSKLRNELLKSTDKLIKEINEYDYSTLTYKNCVTLKRKLENESVDETKKCSIAAASMIDWAITVTKLRIVSGIYQEE